MKVRVVTTLRGFDALGPAWRDLTETTQQTSPFLHHDWFACCWRTAGPDRRREVWTVEDVAGPVAFLPLTLSREPWGVPVRLLRYMTVPDTPLTDIPAIGDLDKVIGSLLGAAEARRDWDVMLLPHLPAGSPTLKMIQAGLSGRFRWRRTATEGLASISFAAGRDASWLAGADRLPDLDSGLSDRLSVEEHRRVDAHGALFHEVVELFRQSWDSPDAFSAPILDGVPRFFRELTERASANNWLHLWVLRLDGAAIATEYQLGADGRRYALRNHGEATRADLAPGPRLNRHILDTLREQRNVREYVVGRASGLPGSRPTSRAHDTVTLRVYAPTAVGHLLAAVDGLVQRWRSAGSAA